MRKENPQVLNKSSPESLEIEAKRQEANDIFEIENPDALKHALAMLEAKNIARLEFHKNPDGSDYAVVVRIKDNKQIFTTSEPSEIAMLQNPTAGIEFLDTLTSQEEN